MSTDDQIDWTRHPDQWPHTPPLEVYRELAKTEPNLFWRMGTGHMQNLLDEAIDTIERVEKLAEKWERKFRPDLGDPTLTESLIRYQVAQLRAALAGETE